MQSFLFSIDAGAQALTDTVISVAEVPGNHFAWLTRTEGGGRFILQLCDAVPMEKNEIPCVTIFDNGGAKLDVPAGLKRSVSGIPC